MLAALLAASLVPTRVAVPPRIDGVLGDPAWRNVPATDRFTQAFPRDGAAPSSPTRLQVAYDDANLYIAIDCPQAVPPVVRLTRRDRDTDGDRVTIDLDTAHDRRSAFHFQISAAGVLLDGLRYDDTELSTDWDEIWDAQVSVTPRGWSAELAIPLRILRLHDGVPSWGFQVRRWIGATGEEDVWAYARRDAGGEVSRYGDLGPFDVAPRGSLAIVPFALGRLVHTDPAVPSPYGNGLSAAAGVDVTWQPAREITLQGAVLPDFGQVEADQLVLNLTTTEVEYPEKRPFFLQGIDLFQTPIQLLYTRRIGRQADTPVLPDGVHQLDAVGTSPVLGAAKLIASAGPVEVGALTVLTGEVTARTDTSGELVAAPAAAHHVVRVRATTGGFTFGAMGTAQTQYDDAAHTPTVGGRSWCPSGDEVALAARCSHDAFVGGLDGGWRSPAGTWTASGQLAGAETIGGPPRELPDGTVLRSGDAGAGGFARVAKEGGWLRTELVYERYGRRFDIDDLGYLPRQNTQHLDLVVGAFSAKPAGPFVDEQTNVEVYQHENLDGLIGPHGYQWNFGVTTRGLWTLWAELHWRPLYYDDRELGDGRALERSGRLGLELEIDSDPRRAVVGSWSSQLHSTHDGWELYATAAAMVRPRSNVELDMQTDLVFARGEPRFVDSSDPAGPRFARQDASSVGITTRANWTLTRNFTLQAYVQALLASLRYRDAFVADPALRVIGLDQLQAASFDAAAYDTREGVLDATIVARWEYRPGSVGYLVYSHAQTPVDGIGFHPVALAHGPASDAVLLKLSWAWLHG